SGASNSAANSPTAPCTASPSAIPASALSLTIGTRGPEVTNLQTFLAIMGYLNRIYITGYFGPLTKAALTSYQLAHPSSCSNTQAPSNNNQTSSNNQISPFARSLKLGMIGNDVKNLQIFLNQHNFTVSQSGAGSSGKETTYFGPATFRALIRFQNAYANQILAPYGLSQGTGFFGPSTMKEVNRLLK
ncbi:MAG: peptidoglycan-binding protein, partial [Patescibacteria group bacterium]|nr:peptidoglycan-binding protein [Patescibacteria group bacterium]